MASGSGRAEQPGHPSGSIVSQLRSHLLDLRAQLREQGPSWYDEKQDARFEASLEMLEQLEPKRAAGPRSLS